jgi:hypothetical protein
LPPNAAPSAIAAKAAKFRKVERLVERMDWILPAIGRLLVASRPAAMPGRDIAPALCLPVDAMNSRRLRLVFSIR